ncbi:tetratricopeptide repeat protein [Flavisolibacter ginsenosidimutans]|uniref:Tetratricopeptide repeat protein n=1 Tax=Flavisolibacter ginsenosidimutans TaxID=661481 RepID=A0A5B8UEG8_9BACT|nr:tetratricopeptide repeat protein [Flavisolibacter ginsenosidimutans]QEC54490.1 tetratricopeptide repeat protein [Flavisolibacter ginsenosidimutans]
MPDHFFICYSRQDGEKFALDLANKLAGFPPAVKVWLDQLDERPDGDWDEQLDDAIKTCKGLLYVMTTDSVQPKSVCKNEWVRALQYKKTIIPLLFTKGVLLPFSLSSREYIDFYSDAEKALFRLRDFLTEMDTPKGRIRSLNHRIADAERDLSRAKEPMEQTRIKEEIADLKKEIAQLQELIDNPGKVQERVEQSIQQGLEQVRLPEKPMSAPVPGKFINRPPLTPPTWFQDRIDETASIAAFLKDEALRIMTIVGRGGVGKTAMVCRLLRSVQSGQLPDDGGPLTVDGIVYLSDSSAFDRVTYPDIFSGLCKLLSDETRTQLEAVYKDPKTTTQTAIESLLAAFPQGRTVLLLDNFEDELDVETGEIKNTELKEALKAILEAPPHGLKILITTRVAPTDFAFVHPELQRRRDLDTGLESPYAEDVLRKMDNDGKIGLRDAQAALLKQAQERTGGYPRALEHLFGILSADRSTSLKEILENTKEILPEKVTAVLVGEAFSRLDATAQMVMQALAVFRYPVPPVAVDYLLKPYVPGINSAGVLSRLVNMQFVRRDAGRFYLHQIDRDYALSRIPKGKAEDRSAASPVFSCFALQDDAAEWFKLARKPREDWKTLEDMAPQLSEFELRCEGEDYDTAANLLLEIDFDYLMRWGHFRLATELHERLQGKINDKELAQYSAGNLGNAYYRMGKFETAIAFYEQSIRLADERADPPSKRYSLNGLGVCYDEMGQAQKALDIYEEALQIYRDAGDQKGEAIVLVNSGIIFANVGRIHDAIKKFEEAVDIDREIKYRDGEAYDLVNLGQRYADLGEYKQALKHYDDAMQCAKEADNPFMQAIIQTSIGAVKMEQGFAEEAVPTFKETIKIFDEISVLQGQNEARMNLAIAYLLAEKFTEAIAMCNAALQNEYRLNTPKVNIVFGIATLRSGNGEAAAKAFATASQKAEEFIEQSPQLYEFHYAKSLALCGLVLCGKEKDILLAKKSFEAAKNLCAEKGVVRRWQLLYDALAKADGKGLLTETRNLLSIKN